MTDAGRLKVLIADGHEHYRGGLVRAIAMHPRLSLGAVTDDGFVALSLILSQQPDVAVLDVRLPGLDGFAVSQRLCRAVPRPGTRVVLLAAVPDTAQRTRARALDAVGPLSKDASRSEICEALLAASHRTPDRAAPPGDEVLDRDPRSKADWACATTHDLRRRTASP